MPQPPLCKEGNVPKLKHVCLSKFIWDTTLAWMFQNRSPSVEVEVMEAFATSDGPSAFLVHHASEAARTTFGEWLRAHDGARIACRLRNGITVEGRIFRVRMCFGRGLILARAPVAVGPKDVVIIY